MTDDADRNQSSRTTRPRWSVFEPQGHENGRGNVPDGFDGDSDAAGSPEDVVSLDPLLVAVAGELRRPVKLSSDLDARVMALIAAEPRPRREAAARGQESPDDLPASGHSSTPAVARAWRWLRRPRLVVITPLGGLAAAAGLAALLFLTVRPGTDGATQAAEPMLQPTAAPTVAAAGLDSVQVIQFVLVAPGAQTVALVGDFNDWQASATPMRAAASGRVWSVQVPLTAGRHRYAFVVDDDQWVADPSAPRASGDDFGTPNSVVTVAERRS